MRAYAAYILASIISSLWQKKQTNKQNPPEEALRKSPVPVTPLPGLRETLFDQKHLEQNL